MKLKGFSELSIDRIIQAAEDGLNTSFTGYTYQLPSYINRVYELEAQDGVRYIAKFYRPGRWNRRAIEDEHTFVFDCEEAEIPAIAPLQLANGETIGETDGIFYAIFPKRSGRAVDIESDRMFLRIGSLLGRIHAVAGKRKAEARIVCHPAESTALFVRKLLDGGFISRTHERAFEDVTGTILERITPLFENCGMTRIHGDCHRGNILDRKGERLHIIDFDDMMMGPPVQDLLLLLSRSCPQGSAGNRPNAERL